ncbi:hypothetical protein NQ317_009413 [Molorchus minor]|uniref:Uncharacterized protein n=1 Tax=Molorchus minor TaxID=1323400 RepID=A0ABQ9JLY0_9CUCU|nr:hypothetical protein NQ317_009413 [Molorchus minor]
MLKYVILLFVLPDLILESSAIWDQEINCPTICTCRLEHLTETAIYRFMQKDKSKSTPSETGSVENNDVLYEESLDTAEILEHASAVVRSAICILQTETEPLELLESLPQNTETITLIQGYESGNKSVKFSYFRKFPALLSLQLVGPNMMNKPINNSHLICELDLPISDLKYLNLERVLIKNGKQQVENFLKEVNEDDLTFEFVQKIDGNTHALTMVQKSTNDEEIIPYKQFKEQKGY